jgi:hypothetical protein
MPISNIPGVGPTNADIATAVAAPSAATIATAVAAPSAATIAAAVAAPSSATIATAVAAAVPTISAINTSVANNAPNPNNWTVIGNSGTGWSTFTFSSVSGYRTLRLFTPRMLSSADGQVQFRINGDSTTNVYMSSRAHSFGGSFGGNVESSSLISLGMTVGSSGPATFDVTFDFANLTTIPKIITGRFGGLGSTYTSISDSFRGYYTSTSAITSLTVILSGGVTHSGIPVYLLGAN